MSFGSRELDRAYDNWKTQSPEDYYGSSDDDDSVIEESDDGFKCNNCGKDKVAHHGLSWKCVGCGKFFSGKELFGDDDYDIHNFNIDVYRQLQFSGRGYEACNLKKAYDNMKNEERLKERKEYSRGLVEDRKLELKSKGLCITCGKNPIHKSSNCITCYEKKKLSAKKLTAKRRNKMEEARKKYEPMKMVFKAISPNDIPQSQGRKSSPFVAQAISEMKYLAIGDALVIPISQQGLTDEQTKITQKRYVYACREASKKLDGTFAVYERGNDVYVERKV